MLNRYLNLRIASDQTVMRCAQGACFIAAALIPILAVRKLSELEVSHAELFIGILATFVLAVFYALLGVWITPRQLSKS